MKVSKRSFLKTLALVGGGSVAPPYVSAQQIGEFNWAGNVRYGAEQLSPIANVEQLQDFVRKHRSLKALGSRHCFSRIAENAHQLISLRPMNRMLEVDAKKGRVVVEGGIRYGDLGPQLHEAGFALHNLASLPHITIAGAMATATHGSGTKLGNLATAVSSFEFVGADGEIHRLSRDGDPARFAGAVVHLGALGILTKIGLEVQPTFGVREVSYRELTMPSLIENLREIMDSAYSVSVFTRWDGASIRLKIREEAHADPAGALFGAKLVSDDGRNRAGTWYDRLPHFRMDSLPAKGKELHSEYFVGIEHGARAVEALTKLGAGIRPVLKASELRTVEADDLWMSPCYRRSSLAIHFTWKADPAGVRAITPAIEKALSPYEPRPHWGKLFGMDPATLRSRYERLGDFREMIRTFDPDGVFQNHFTREHLGL